MYRIFKNTCSCKFILQKVDIPISIKNRNSIFTLVPKSTFKNAFTHHPFATYSVSSKNALHHSLLNGNKWSCFTPLTSIRHVERTLQRVLVRTSTTSNHDKDKMEDEKEMKKRNRTTLIYLIAAAIATVGFSYAAVPLYRIFCQATGYAGTTQKKVDVGDELEVMKRIEDRMLTIRFEGNTAKSLHWKFKPQQKEVVVAPGETALAFYTAENLSDRQIIGISTYNVIPFDAGKYFNKIQCFCFEEQQLNPHEEVDMPVFFYIDPEFDEDPSMEKVKEIILAYTFFESVDGRTDYG